MSVKVSLQLICQDFYSYILVLKVIVYQVYSETNVCYMSSYLV